jgi:hypothetical protein
MKMPKQMQLQVLGQVQDVFFDRDRVIQQIGRENARRLSKAGAFIRRRARSKLGRPRKRVSRPGEAPSVHSSNAVATLKNILFSLNRSDESMVVGPVKLNMKTRNWITLGTTTVPQLMEHGGVAMIEEEKIGSLWFRRDLRRNRRADRQYRRRKAVYQPRPFMRPSLVAEARAGTIAGLFAYAGA